MRTLTIGVLIIICQASVATVTRGFYVGIVGGLSNNIVVYNNSASYGLNTSGSQLYNSKFGGNLGINFGYNNDGYSGFEVGYSNYFPITINVPNSNVTSTMGANAISLSYLPMLPTLMRFVTIYGRLGVAYTSVDEGLFNQCNCCSTNRRTFSGAGFSDYLGAGIRYRQSGNLSFRLEWIANGLLFPVGIGQNSSNVANWYNQNFSIGFNYHF